MDLGHDCEVEIERMRESRSKGKYGEGSFGLERQVEPLVMPSKISGLPSVYGYLKLENLVVRLHFRFIHVPAPHLEFVERQVPATPDPSVAYHAVMFNLTETADGTVGPVQAPYRTSRHELGVNAITRCALLNLSTDQGFEGHVSESHHNPFLFSDL